MASVFNAGGSGGSFNDNEFVGFYTMKNEMLSK